MLIRERSTLLVMFILIVLQGSKPTKDITPIVARPTTEPTTRPLARRLHKLGVGSTRGSDLELNPKLSDLEATTLSCVLFLWATLTWCQIWWHHLHAPNTSTEAEGTIFVHVDAGGIHLLTAHKRLRVAWHWSEMSVTEMFSYIQGFLSADQDVREVWMNSPPHSVATKHVSPRRRLAINVSN